MTSTEILVAVGGLVIGWLLVSKLMTRSKIADDATRGDPNATWDEILGVAEDASPATIRSAYESRLVELEHNQPSIMTQRETQAHAEGRARIEAAHREGLAEQGGLSTPSTPREGTTQKRKD